MTLVQARGLCKQFGRVTAVDDVSFVVARGEVTGFLGPNGAGKSTTMRMLTGFLPADRGLALIHGVDVAEDPWLAKQRLGYLPEGAPAYGDMTVAEFLRFIGRMRGMSRSNLRERMAEMVERVHLASVWNRRIENLSKGYARRVGIAQTLLHDPDVLVLDEPTDGLDPNQKHEMRSLIREIAPAKAIIISTHILEEVEAVCTRAIIIADGRIVADRTPQAFMQRDDAITSVQVLVPSDAAAMVIGGFKAEAGVTRVSVVEHVGRSTRLVIESDGTGIVPAEVVRRLTAAHISVEEVSLYRPRLEEVFRRITGTPTNIADGRPAGGIR